MTLAAIKGKKTLAESAQQFDVYPKQIIAWKGQLVDAAAGLFGSGGAAADVTLEHHPTEWGHPSDKDARSDK